MKTVKIIIAIVSIGLISWQVYVKGMTMNSKDNGKTVTLILDEKEDVFKKRMAKELSIEDYPMGMSFHEFNFPNMNFSPKENKIIVKVADSSLTFEYAMGYMVSMAHIRKANNISMSFGMGEGKGGVMHEEAKARMYEILEQIVDAGWKRYISMSSPRICGEEALWTELLDSNISGVGLDPNYFMNFKEWFSISTYHWNFFYKNEAFMDITLHRQSADKDLEKPGGYFLSIDIKSVEHVSRSNFKPEERDNWRELFLKELPRWRAFRPEEEKDAIAKGYHICTNYEDAPRNIGILPPPTKDETVLNKQETPSIIIRSGALCPKSGLWRAFLPPNHPQVKLIEKSNAHTIHCAKGTHILKFGLSPEDEAQVRWLFISEDQESYDPNKL
jgi:hypothetical protein